MAAAASIVAAPDASAQTVVTKCVTDGSMSTQLCFTLTYDTIAKSNTTYVSLKRVSVVAKRLDNQARILNLKLGALTFGRCYSGCGVLDQGKLLVNASPPTLGHSYGATPSWSSAYTMVTGANYFTCAVAGLEWARQGLSENHTADYCVGHPPDTLVVSDRERGLH